MRASPESSSREGDELALVLTNVRDLTGGCGIALVQHPSSAEETSLLYADEATASTKMWETDGMLKSIDEAIDWVNGRTGWHARPIADGTSVFLIPIEPIQGHSPTALVIVFSAGEAGIRAGVEEAYSRRHPILLAYFRLWQRERLRQRRLVSLEAALDLTQLGVILIDQSGDIAFANNAAEDVLEEADGLRRVGNSIRATDLPDGVRLQVALNHVAAMPTYATSNAEPATILALHRKSGPPLILSLLAPAVAGLEPTDVAAIAFLVDSRRDTAAMLHPVCRLYRLSPVETQLVCHLSQGKTLSEAAELMHVKEQTARSYMKQIFLKTDTNRQTELVVLMLSSVVRMKAGQAQKALGDPQADGLASLLRS